MRRAPLYIRLAALVVGAALAAAPVPVLAFSRVKDLVEVQGIRDNMLVGYGLVVGLNGTGDCLKNAPFTQQSHPDHAGAAGRQHPRPDHADQECRRRDGDRQPARLRRPRLAHRRVGVGAWAMPRICRAAPCWSPPLFGADGQIYALAQGPVAIGGFSAQGDAASVTRGVPTAGRISNGAIVEKETGFKLASLTNLKLSLHNPDLTTATRIAKAVNAYLGGSAAAATDPSNVAAGACRPIIPAA